MNTAISNRLIWAFSNFLYDIKRKEGVNWQTQTILENLLGDNQLDILIADDDDDDKELLTEALTEISDHIKVTTVADGKKLLDRLNSGSLPDLIFLDLNMPCKNGFECLEETKTNQKFKDIPVLIYSTSANPDQVEHTYTQGAKFFIQKPNSFIEIKKTLQKVLSFSSNKFFAQPTRKEFLFKA